LLNKDISRGLKWLLVVISLIAGVAWILAAFDVFSDAKDFNFLYLCLGIVFITAGVFWLFSLRSA